MSNRDIDEAMALLRDFDGGREPYAPNVSPMARALKKHTQKAISDAFGPLRNLVIEVLQTNPRAAAVTVPLSSVIGAMNAGALLRDDPELSEKLAAHLPGVVPVQEEGLEEVANNPVRESSNSLLER